MDDLAGIVVSADKYRSEEGHAIQMALDKLEFCHYKVSGGISGSYWMNVKNEMFAHDSLTHILSLLINEIKSTKKKDSDFFLPPNGESLLYAITHLGIAYNYIFHDNLWKPPFEQLMSFNIPSVTSVLMKIQKDFSCILTSFKGLVADIVEDHKSSILNMCVPLFTFTKILRVLSGNRQSFWFFVAGFKERLELSNSIEQSIISLHLLRVILTVFPGIAGVELQSTLKPLYDYLAKPSPVSDIASMLGLDLECETENHGAAYYKALSSIVSDNSAFDGAVPLLFDQKCTFFANFAFSKANRFDSITFCLINFLEFFVKSKFRSNIVLKTDRAISVLSNLTFDEEGLAYARKKLKIKKEDIPPDVNVSANDLMPPIFRFLLTRISLAYPITALNMISLDDTTQMFSTPLPILLQKPLFLPVLERVSQVTDQGQLVNQPVLLAGDDQMISDILSAVYHEYFTKPEEMSRIVFTWYLIPLDNSAINKIADFISEIDPVYKRFVRPVYPLASSISPTLDESSTVEIPSIIQPKSQFSSHTWFSDPSPQNMFQFSMHHFLLFGRDTISVALWRAELTLTDGTRVLVPWVTAVHIGDIFSGDAVKNPTSPISAKTIATVNIIEPVIGRYTESKIKLRSLSVWNIMDEMKVQPTNEWVMAEWTTENFVFKTGEQRTTHAKKITSKITDQIAISVDSGPAFKLVIDHRTYDNVQEIAISKLIDPCTLSRPKQLQEQMKMRFATFCNSG